MIIDVYEKIDDKLEKKIKENLDKNQLQKGIEAYIKIQKAIQNAKDIANVKDTYKSFYRMQWYNDDFTDYYFKTIKCLKVYDDKKLSNEKNETDLKSKFIEILEELFDRGVKKYEMSFTSKLLHTVDPDLPIWDRIVAKHHFGIIAPERKEINNIENVYNLYYNRYKLYKKEFDDFAKDEERGVILAGVFDELFKEKYINTPGFELITPAKKIDFILWQDRDK